MKEVQEEMKKKKLAVSDETYFGKLKVRSIRMELGD